MHPAYGMLPLVTSGIVASNVYMQSGTTFLEISFGLSSDIEAWKHSNRKFQENYLVKCSFGREADDYQLFCLLLIGRERS